MAEGVRPETWRVATVTRLTAGDVLVQDEDAARITVERQRARAHVEVAVIAQGSRASRIVDVERPEGVPVTRNRRVAAVVGRRTGRRRCLIRVADARLEGNGRLRGRRSRERNA